MFWSPSTPTPGFLTSKHLLISAQRIVSQELHKSNMTHMTSFTLSPCVCFQNFQSSDSMSTVSAAAPRPNGLGATPQSKGIRCSVSLQGHNLGGLRIMLHWLQYISIPYPTTAARSSLVAASVQYITKAFQGSYVIKTTNSVTNCQKSRDATGTQEHHGVITKI